jgi:hypothetical protein
MGMMRISGWRHWVAAVAFLLAVFAAGFFALRTVRHAIYWSQHKDETIRPWMSVHYVSRSYRVPPPVLYQAIGLSPAPHDRRPLREIALEQHRPVDALILELQKAIDAIRQQHQLPPPPPSSDGGNSP